MAAAAAMDLLSSWSSSLSERTSYSRPLAFAYIALVFIFGAGHFWWFNWRSSWYNYRCTQAVLSSSATCSSRVSANTLLCVRATIFVWCFGLLVQSSFAEGASSFKFFTVWNFVALTIFFALGTGLSCSCCRRVARLQTPSADHRLAAAIHHALLEVELPMSVLIAAVVWLVIYPYDQKMNNEIALRADLSLTSLSMHAANVLVMLAEFALDSLLIRPQHVGLVLAWAMLYALFDGLQAVWTEDTIYFFMDFTIAKTPLVAVGLTALLCAIFAIVCALSRCKQRMLRKEPAPPAMALLVDHPEDACTHARQSGEAEAVWGSERASLGSGADERCYSLYRDAAATEKQGRAVAGRGANVF